jgi:hypothetical protein
MQIEGAIADSIHTGLSGFERTVRSDTVRDVSELLRWLYKPLPNLDDRERTMSEP